MEKTYRIIDANTNRVSEGLRVIEDILRFVQEDRETSGKCRDLRHAVRKKMGIPDLISSRNSETDVGRKTSAETDADQKKDGEDLLRANFKRVEEGLRTLEESLKIVGRYPLSKEIEAIRFGTYVLEKRCERYFRKRLPHGIYGITAEKYSNGRKNIDVVKAMIDGGVSAVQYREKHAWKNFGEMYKECEDIRRLTAENDVLFMVNDYIELALAVGADGVHVGQDDLPVSRVRQMVGNKVIGLSTHSPEQAENAVKAGVDYIGVGPIYETRTKEDVCDAVGLEYLEYVVDRIDLPFVAIGGIKEYNIDEVIRKGANTISLVTEIVGTNDIAKKVKALNEKMKALKVD